MTVQPYIGLSQQRNNFMLKPVVAVQQWWECVWYVGQCCLSESGWQQLRANLLWALAIMFCAQPSICQSNQHWHGTRCNIYAVPARRPKGTRVFPSERGNNAVPGHFLLGRSCEKEHGIYNSPATQQSHLKISYTIGLLSILRCVGLGAIMEFWNCTVDLIQKSE